jgi:hypothetical protein
MTKDSPMRTPSIKAEIEKLEYSKFVNRPIRSPIAREIIPIDRIVLKELSHLLISFFCPHLDLTIVTFFIENNSIMIYVNKHFLLRKYQETFILYWILNRYVTYDKK